jgi:hypothetical protein
MGKWENLVIVPVARAITAIPRPVVTTIGRIYGVYTVIIEFIWTHGAMRHDFRGKLGHLKMSTTWDLVNTGVNYLAAAIDADM